MGDKSPEPVAFPIVDEKGLTFGSKAAITCLLFTQVVNLADSPIESSAIAGVSAPSVLSMQGADQVPQHEFVEKEKQFLIDERDHLIEELEHLREFMQAEVDVEPDEGDAEIFEREKNAALIAVLENRLKDVEAALKSMEKGRYGICERCEQPIELARLEVKPDATMCLNCQQEVERLARRGRGPSRPFTW